MTLLLISIGKCVAFISRIIGIGNGSTWPGHIALSLNKHFIQTIQKKSEIKVILIVGTNGKTTTGKMITTILQKNEKKVIQNTSGANLLNGIASSLLLNANLCGKVDADFAIFEIDENILPLVLDEISPFAVIVLNLFRDQLDRYGELDSIAKKWKQAFATLSPQTVFILNADDPQIAYLGKNRDAKVLYFGLDEKGTQHLQHASDSIYCPRCNSKLSFETVYFSHLGIWHCARCKLSRPKPSLSNFLSPLAGKYNQYNTLAAVLFAKQIGTSEELITQALHTITPAFGRQEKIEMNGKFAQIFLSKNPASFNQSLQTIAELKGKHILFVLNDRIPDGKDVSWIWDVDVEDYIHSFESIFVSGDRVYDMALRIQYSENLMSEKIKTFASLEEAIRSGLATIAKGETLYILPTYSAMLDVRKILTGKKIL